MSEKLGNTDRRQPENEACKSKKANPVMNYVLGIAALLLSIVLIMLLYWAVDTILLKFLGAALLWIGNALAKLGNLLAGWSVALNEFKATVAAYTGWREVLSWVVAVIIVGAVQMFLFNNFSRRYKNHIRNKIAKEAENANKAWANPWGPDVGMTRALFLP